MKKALMASLALSALGMSGLASARTVTPELAIMRYYNTAGKVEYAISTSAFTKAMACPNKAANCTRFDTNYTYWGLAKQNEIQLRVKLGNDYPTQEACYYYDYDGPSSGWMQVTQTPRCRHYTGTDGKPRTWMTESADLMDSTLGYWSIHKVDRTAPKPYMAYGYNDGSGWQYVWVYSGWVPIV